MGEPTLCIDEYDVKIVSYLNNGVYVFFSELGSGKTRLNALLTLYGGYGEKVCGYTYDDYLRGIDLRTIVKPDCRLIMLDRYDMYYEMYREEIEKYSENAAVLVDSKVGIRLNKRVEMCSIEFKRSEIVIS